MPTNFCPYFHQILADFKNSFTHTLRGKFAITTLLNAFIGVFNNVVIANFPQSVPVKLF